MFKIPVDRCRSGAAVLMLGAVSVLAGGCSFGSEQHAPAAVSPPPGSAFAVASARPQPDLSGHTRVGIASFYAQWFAGRKMADGVKMDPHGKNAASRTLPLGSTAKVINMQTGQSAVVVIEDRGPYVDGRIVDLSPATARKIGITERQGIAKVVVAPITVTMPDGSVKLGSGARRSDRRKLIAHASLE